jgi:FHA domain
MDMTFQVIDPPAFAEALQWGTGYFHHRAKLSLRLENDTAIPIPLSAKTVVLGRGIELSVEHVDLNRYRAAELGVSRRHARIDRNRDTLQIVDLDSSNGTFLNRQRLVPGVPHILRNRAILQLARLTLRVQFE